MGLNDTYRNRDADAPAPVVVGLFNRGEDAQRAITDLRDHGFRAAQIGAAFREPPARRRPVDAAAEAERRAADRVRSDFAGTRTGANATPSRGGERWWDRLKQSFYEDDTHAAPPASDLAQRTRFNNTDPRADTHSTAGRFITARETSPRQVEQEYDYETPDFETSLSQLGIPRERAGFLAQNLVEGGAIVTVTTADRAREAELILENHRGLVRYESGGRAAMTSPAAAAYPDDYRDRERPRQEQIRREQIAPREAEGDEYADRSPRRAYAEEAADYPRTTESYGENREIGEPPAPARPFGRGAPKEPSYDLRRSDELAANRPQDEVREERAAGRTAPRYNQPSIDRRRADEVDRAEPSFDRPRADELRALRPAPDSAQEKLRADELRARRQTDQPAYDRRRADERPPRPQEEDDYPYPADRSGPVAVPRGERPPAEAEPGRNRMQLFGEVLRVHKDRIDRGEVRVRKEVVTEKQMVEVPVSREELVIERRSADGKVTPDDPFHGEKEMRIPLSGDQVRVEKEPVVREEVAVGKREVTDTQSVDDQVRREELRVDDRELKDLGNVHGTDASVRRPA